MTFLDWIFRRRRPASDNVSPAAHLTLTLACQEADRLFHAFVGTEHLLLALLSTNEGQFAFKEVGIDPVELKKEVQRSSSPGSTVERRQTLSLTPRARQVLVAGAKEAELLGHGCLGPEHLVLGLLRLRKGVAWRSIKHFPVTLDGARARIRDLLAASSPPRRPSP